MPSLPSIRVAAFGLIAILSLAGCPSDDGGAPDPTPEPAADPAGDPGQEPADDTPAKIDIEAVRNEARTAMFIPAPTEFQAALKAANVDIDLASMLKKRGGKLDGKSKPIIALISGVRLADVLLGAGGDKAAVLARLKSAREGLGALGTPADTLAAVDKLISDFEAGTVSGRELAPALDVLAEQVQDDLSSKMDPATATLVQAGGWVEGAHLLSSGLGKAGVAGDAALLLRQPTVLAYFLDFLKKNDAAGNADVAAVIVEMQGMSTIAQKPELGSDDIAAIAKHTGAILARF